MPRIAITVSLALVVASVGIFIRYISHIANMVRVATVVSVIGEETRRLADAHVVAGWEAFEAAARTSSTPASSSPDQSLEPAPLLDVPAPRSGVLVSLNTELLVSLAAELDVVLTVCMRVGDFVPRGVPAVRGARRRVARRVRLGE